MKPRVLILEDTDLAAKMTMATTHHLHLAYIWHPDLERARGAHRYQPFDVYIIDVNVQRNASGGDANGLDLAEEVRRDRPEALIIVTTTAPSAATIDRADRLWCCLVEKKPGMHGSLESILQEYLAKRRSR